MAWEIKCIDKNCQQSTWAYEIVDLTTNHIDKDGWFLCKCGHKGYIYKKFNLQEVGQVWEPYLLGVVPLGYDGDSYQPFAFMVSYNLDTPPDSIWLSYYKDLRANGGKLKMGYGPGGPPVLEKDMLMALLRQLKLNSLLSNEDFQELLK